MKTKLLLFSILFASVSGAKLKAQVPYSSNDTYEMAASDLRSAPPRQYNFSKAVMSDVMRLMAEDAGISFFGLPDAGDGNERMVTFTINAAPFTALETLAKANGVSLIHENGIWYIRPANDSELIGRIYEINYNAQELVKKNGQGSSLGNSSSGSQQSGGGGGGGISLQGAPDFFEVEPSRLLDDIKGILDIPTTGAYANIAATTSVDTIGQLSLRGFQNQPGIAAPAMNESDNADSQAKVIWNSDSNTLYVVASRQQHQWIEAYLASADREQTMIAVEIKFLETSRDPNLDLGIDWTGMLGGQNGINTGLSGANTGILDLGNIANATLPVAVLSYSDLNMKLKSIYTDSSTRSVSYPRMVTLDNREVTFRSVINQPVLSSSASASLGAGATQTSAIEYLPIGTVINVLPKTMTADKILLNVSVTVSDIVGTEVINGNPFPIASSRVYTAPLTVRSGYTVAISGLDAANCSSTESGVPFFGQLPGLGAAFKFKNKRNSRQHLMMLITPVIINGCGVSKKPITKDPWCTPCGEAIPAKGGLSAVPTRKYNSSFQARKTSHSFGRKEASIKETAYASATPVRPSSVNSVPTFAQPISGSSPVVSPQVVATPLPTSPARVGKTPVAPAKPDPQIVQIDQRINDLRSTLDKAQPSDKTKINEVVAESKTLLSQIEAIRGSDTSSMTGELGDTWWKVIKLKTDATKMSRE